jgi:hypothetical protein
VSSPYGYWYMALEEIARTLRPDDPTLITDTKAIRKAVLAPDEAVIAYMTSGDHEAVTLWVLTNYRRVVRIHFSGNGAQFRSFPLTDIHCLGGTIDGIQTRMTEVAGFDAVSIRFVLGTDDAIELALPMSAPNSVAGREEIEFAQKLMGALFIERSS